MERTELETMTRNLIAYDVLKSPLSSLYQKAGRQQKKTAQEAAELILQGSIAERVDVRIEQIEEEKARTMREGVGEFKKKYPQYGKILEGLIQEKRIEKNQALVYSLQNGFKLASADYIRVMKNLGLSETAAHAMYGHLLELSERLEKASETQPRQLLL